MSESAPFVFPVPLPVLLGEGGKEDPNKEILEETQKQTELLEEESEKEEEFRKAAGVDSKKEDKMRKQQTAWGKLQDKITKQWDKVGVGKYFKTLLGKVGVMTQKIGSFASSFLDNIMELMLFAAVDPKGGLIAAFIGAIIPLFINLVGMLAHVIAKLIPQLIKMFVKMIPALLSALFGIIDAIIEAIPAIIDAIIMAVPIIIDALIIAIPKIVGAIMDGVIQTMKALKDKLPIFKPLLEFVEGFAVAVKDLFDPSKGELLTRIGNFVTTIFDSLWEFLSKGLVNSLDKLKNKLNELFPGYEKLIEFTMNFIKILGVIGVIIGAIIIGIKIFAIIGAIIAAWPVLLVIALVALVALVVTYWDEIKQMFVDAFEYVKGIVVNTWKKIRNAFSENFDTILEIVEDGIRLLLLPFTWPLELGWYVYKNFNKIKKMILTALNYILDMIGKVFGDDIKKKLLGAFDFIRNFDVGDTIRRAVQSAFNNIPGLNTIKQWFDDLFRWIENSPIGRALDAARRVFGGGSTQSTGARTIDAAFGNIDDRKAEFIKSVLQSGEDATIVAKAQSELAMSEEQARQMRELIGELRRTATAKGENIQNLVVREDQASLNKLTEVVAAVKQSNARRMGILQSSNTAQR